jgi:hypothetical protein
VGGEGQGRQIRCALALVVAGGPVEGRVTGDRFQFWQLSNASMRQPQTDEMNDRLQWWNVGEFRLRRVERSAPAR